MTTWASRSRCRAAPTPRSASTTCRSSPSSQRPLATVSTTRPAAARPTSRSAPPTPATGQVATFRGLAAVVGGGRDGRGRQTPADVDTGWIRTPGLQAAAAVAIYEAAGGTLALVT